MRDAMPIRTWALAVAVLVSVVCGSALERPKSDAQQLPGLLLVNLTVKDPAQFEAYGAKLRPIVAAHKAAPLFRATNPTVLFGEQPYKVLIGFRFPSKAAIKEFYNSSEYQALIPLRTAGADVIFTAYEIAQEPPSEDMRALLAVNLTVKDAARFGEYGDALRPILQAHGGKLLLRAINPEPLFGEQRHKTLVLFKFPDQRVLREFYNSEAYQKLIPVRTAGADVVFTGYDL
jgi:uncharacterized protein (DUF1330 family)